MPYILLGEPAYKRYCEALYSIGLTPVMLPPDKRLNNTVCTHADTLIYSDGKKHIINEEYAAQLSPELLEGLCTIPDTPYGDYPTDTAFNALTVGGCIFARLSSLSPYICEYAKARGIEAVNVKQGYAKCSTLALAGANAAITADVGMEKALSSHGVDTLMIERGHIALDGCEYGFIGGASFVLESTHTVYFFGNIEAHPDGEIIKKFLAAHGYQAVSLDGELTDYGGAVII